MTTVHRILVPFELPDADPVSPGIVETLASVEVVVLGRYGLPEQTPPSVARSQYEAEMQMELEELAGPFESAARSVTTRLIFGHDRGKAIDRAAVEEDCDVILTPGQTDAVEELFVPLRGKENLDRIVSFVGELLSVTDASVTLFHAGEESDRLSGEKILSDATERLVEAGVDPDRITQQLSEDEVEQSIADREDAFDLLVFGETEPSLRDRVFGTVPAQVTADMDSPAFVVRNSEQI